MLDGLDRQSWRGWTCSVVVFIRPLTGSDVLLFFCCCGGGGGGGFERTNFRKCSKTLDWLLTTEVSKGCCRGQRDQALNGSYLA